MAADGTITDLSPGVQTWANAKAEIEEELAALAAPQYLVSASNSLLSAERVATDTSTIAWDFVTAGQAKASVVDGSISYAKLQQVAASSLLGNPTGVLATVAAITLGATLAFSGSTLQTAAATGDVTWSANSFVTSIGAGKVTNTMLAGSIAASKLIGTDIATVGTITSGVWNAGAVTSSGTITGNLFSGSGASLTNLNASNLASGTVPTARLGSGTANNAAFLRGDGVWSNSLYGSLMVGSSAVAINKLGVSGAAAIGSGYADVYTAPTNGLLVEGNVGIGVTSAPQPLTVGGRTDIYSGGLSLIVGADANLTTRTDSVSKVCRVGFPHYLAAEENSAICYCASDASNNTLVFGGGTSLFNAATLIRFQTAADTITTTGSERMRITSAGNVGIGTTNPFTNLDVVGSNALLRIGNDTSNAGTVGIEFGHVVSANNQQKTAIFSSYRSDLAWGRSDLVFALNSTADLSNVASSTDAKLIIKNNGNVGIGTTGPLNKLGVSGAAAIGSGYAGVYTAPTNGLLVEGIVGIGLTSAGGGNVLDVGGSIRSYLSGGSNIRLGFSGYQTRLGATHTTSEGYFYIQGSSDNFIANFKNLAVYGQTDNEWRFYTNSSEKVRIDKNGKISIGTTGSYQLLHVNGNAGIVASGYLNFGTTDGSSGYGIRDNAGVMEYKGSGGSWSPIGGGGGGGTVTSVGLSLPAEFSVTVSPITTNGSLTAIWANQSANIVFAGPSSGGAATPAFRSLVINDLPGSIPSSKFVGTDIATVGTITSGVWNAGAVTSSGTITGNLFSGSGASLTNLNASNLSSGTVPTARLGSGTATASKFLRGDQQWIQIAPWIDVKADYGAVGDGTTDDTAAINNAIAAANAATYTPSIYFPPGNYKVTAALTTVTKPVIVRGAGINATTITVSNPNYDVFKFIKGSAGRIVGGGVRDLTITGTGTRSSGYAITVDYFGHFDISDVSITSIYNGIYARQYNDLRIHKTYIGPIYGLYGLRLYGDGSTRNGETDRSDVLNAVNLVIDGNLQNASTEGARIDGNIHTVQGNSFQVLGCKRGLYVTNTPATTAPSFIIISDYESENCTDECIRVNCAGESFWFNNLYCVGTTGVQVSTGLVYFEGGATDIKLNVGRIAGGYNYGLICDGVDRVDVTDVDVYNNSRQTANTWDGIYLGNAAVPRFTMKGGMSKGANQRYGLHVVNVSGTRVALAGPDFTGNVTAGLYDPGSKKLAGSFNW